MNIKLKTDFSDYYDHWFDREGRILERYSNGGMKRSEMLGFLKNKGEFTPRFGRVKDLAKQQIASLVIYTNETAHRSEGKVLLPTKQALDNYTDSFASEYLTPDKPSTSIRRLQIGQHCFWLAYQSTDSWRSNFGEVTVTLLQKEFDYHPSIDVALFAIDYVPHEDKHYAVDFNIAPQIKGTGIEDILSAKEIVQSLKICIKRDTED
ncbi:hypothetical protein PP175_29160 (plasmid) [Aneurinibacillus sp. Ricciae_BoGa-3]|uniref:hypothetical protein n=1 Tax=Aneurinibacillus sp. Ricciae_BoGa-3 TaxID=3022697 RepID=UPI0023418B9C|nr:hypothetical protein [Aneurinibacillus sp. Ricciae_BoGa-3]WCK57262.1 hypothetical protein PP175_29160 [Aneurinibacillus sp. Ricciae_BoGa-3]